MIQPIALRDSYRAEKSVLLASLATGGASTRGINATLRALSDLADTCLRTLWRQAGFSAPFALLAVGGFGRRELFPYSDVDVLVLLPDNQSPEEDAGLKTKLEGFIGSCWDAGFEIGSSVRSISECMSEAAKDTTVQTALLEARLIIGSKTLFAALQNAYFLAMDPEAFYTAKMLEMQQRHNKFEDTPYALEPNCKDSPGGLRDLQTILWVAKAAGLGSDWDALARAGLATAFEISQIKHNEAVLRLIRARLHLLAKRHEDRLVFDLQTSVANSFGYQATDTNADPYARARPSQRLMRRYYWAAKAVTQLCQILLLNIEERLRPALHEPQPLIPLNEYFFNKAGMLEVLNDDLYRNHPHTILQTFLVYQTHFGLKGLSARTLRALYNARNLMGSDFRHDPVNRKTFMRILQQHDGITHTMRLMNQTSVLGRYLSAFRRIVGQMQHDLSHIYTVDQHILMVLRNIRRFFMVEHAHEYPFCSQLASGWEKPWILYIAALFHDIAKGRGGDHAHLGAQETRQFCARHGIAKDDALLIEFLVRGHLTMSSIAQKSDLNDPNVIADFALFIGNDRALTGLYLLTVADIRGTSPKVWNAWKGRLLEDLYLRTSRSLGGHVPDLHAEVQERKRDALIELALRTQPYGSHEALWQTLDVGYFIRHDAVEIGWHTRMLSRHLGGSEPVVRGRPSPVGEGLQILVYTPDQQDLFARICGYFDHSGFSIQDAHIHTTQNGYALDTFQIVAAYHLTDNYRELINMIEVELAQVISEAHPLPAPMRGRVSRRVRSFPMPPRVSLKPDEKAQRWLLNISASDRLGLLYSVALVLARHKVNLQLAKIVTMGERVEDTFLIQGASLQHNLEQIAIETELLETLA